MMETKPQYKFASHHPGCNVLIEADSLTDAYEIHNAVILKEKLEELEADVRDFLEHHNLDSIFSYTGLLDVFIDGRAETVCQ